ncbi:MAG: UDP-N-acetylglucosamine--N-acetylmuramyl-(pentapeptide) pyrophosphoryl-undecaprenol N-acetylglucosamine transferase [Simkaniaceae bacterium]|nr:UDP-N-acetylglucosamine--N-acetylmuramyl-(pentapeptide) pyrophosphoryl-undecaprenol N-acetylglucosamine transferase [Simkaniaceae bacterium]
MKKTIIIAAGGTGGHIFPATALARQLKDHVKVVFMGTGLSQNRFFQQSEFIYYDVQGATIFQKTIWKKFKACFLLSIGILKAIWSLLKERPKLIIGFGSFHSFPVILAGRILKIPYILFESNARAGKVNRWHSLHAKFSAIQFNAKGIGLKEPLVQVGMPYIKPQEVIDPYSYFQLSKTVFTILVFGGSQGALTINQLFLTALAYLKGKYEFQVIHLIGKEAECFALKQQYTETAITACIKTFEEKMHLAWTAADICISRAGAMTLAEQIQYEVPSILIPYPNATDNHQALNADFMENIVSGAVHFKPKLDAAVELAYQIEQFLVSPKTIERKKSAITAFKNQEERQDLQRLILQELL